MGVFCRQAARYGDRPLVHHLVGDTWQARSWNDMRRDILAVASNLLNLGIKPGDRVILLSENRLEWIYCDFAIQAVGGVTVPVYPNSTAEMAQKIALDSGAVLAIASKAASEGKLEVGDALKTIVLIDAVVHDWVAGGPSRTSEVSARLQRIKPDDLCTIVYTSGTTGDPKGVELAHRNLVDISRAAVKVHPITDADSSLSFLPYAHVFERINDIFVGLVYGGQTWISRGADHLAQELGEVQPTVMCSVPRMYEKMHSVVMARFRESSAPRRAVFSWALGVGRRRCHSERPGPVLAAQHRLADRLVLGPLRRRLTGGRLRFFISGGAALSKDVEEFFWAIGVPILNGWGMTETSSGVCSNTLHEHRFLTVGKPFPGVEIKIAGDGEILVKGPGNMLGYRGKPEATAEVLKEGWIFSGDVGEIDSDGFLKITDRKKSLFKTAGGKYIAPLPLEHALLANPLVLRGVIVGESRPYVTALIVPDRAAAQKQGLDEPALKASIQSTVDDLNAKLGRWETIKYFTLLPNDFTEESGELSLKLDIKRQAVASKYAPEIDAMYTDKSRSS
ncbi:MAG TPA: AMP-dependent synthetase/ligase [Candidatus Dormibacteraeota bacterium]|jgi:long-chain acyl-CoA synthetase